MKDEGGKVQETIESREYAPIWPTSPSECQANDRADRWIPLF